MDDDLYQTHQKSNNVKLDGDVIRVVEKALFDLFKRPKTKIYLVEAQSTVVIFKC